MAQWQMVDWRDCGNSGLSFCVALHPARGTFTHHQRAVTPAAAAHSTAIAVRQSLQLLQILPILYDRCSACTRRRNHQEAGRRRQEAGSRKQESGSALTPKTTRRGVRIGSTVHFKHSRQPGSDVLTSSLRPTVLSLSPLQ